MSLVRGALQPGLSVVKKTAPFYSAVDEALAAIKRPKGTGAEFYTELTKQAGVKKAELADRKLEQAFKAKGKMTKEEAQQVLKDNPPPQLKERQLAEISENERDNALRDKIETSGYDSWDEVPSRVIQKWNDEIDEDLEKYGDYKTAGGKNYREILLKLPEGFSEAESNRLMTLEADMRRSELPDYKKKELLTLQAKKQGAAPSYQSKHWKEDPNVLAHMRVQDRVGPNGEKILHVEEIQSDWHQEGRKKGYATGKEEQDYVDYLSSLELRAKNEAKQDFISEGVAEDKAEVMASRLAKRLAEDPRHLADYFGADVKAKQMELNKARVDARSAIPDAPFKKNWHELAMKRLLNYAADNGYDSIAITPGAEQAKRFSLSKQIDELIYSDDGSLYASKGGKKVFNERLTPEQLPDYVGKEVAEKLVTAQPNEVGSRVLGGLDLEVGGEGMKGFYDQILPSYLNTFGKPYNAQMGTFSIPGDRGATVERLGVAGRNLSEMTPQEVIDFNKMVDEAGAMKLHNFPITPEMRESIKQKGLPLYQQVGIPTAGAGAASQMLEPEEEPQYGTGGGVAKSAIKQAHLAKLAKMRQEMAPRAEAVKSLIARDQNSYLRDVAPNSLTNPEIEAEIRRMAARAKASGQQEGVLPLAQREANKAKYLEKSKEKNVMYHGTDEDISEFRPYTFVTPDPKVADQYPGGGEPAGQNIMPVHVRAENPFDYEIPSHIHKLSSIIKDKQLLKDIKDGYWQSIESPDVLEAIQKLGFDSFYSPDMAKNLGVFKPEQIKSAIGNRGTFDPLEPEVNKAKGGKVRMTTNRDTMFMELSNKKLKRK